MLQEREIRTLPGAELRVQEEEGLRIEGYAAVFDELSEDFGPFREVIRPGAFDRALEEGHDVRALVDHDPLKILARRSAGTLELAVDKRGLKVSIAPGAYSYTADVVESIRRGDRSGMSFAFRTIAQAWVENEEEESLIRELLDLELLDVSPVVFPAYPATSVSVSKRALEEAAGLLEKPPASMSRLSLLRAKLKLSSTS